MTDVIGGVAEIPDSCIGDVVTDFHKQQGIINEFQTRQLAFQSPFLGLGMRTRKAFPAGMGDVYTKVTLTSNMPTSSVGRNWTSLKAAYPGGPVPTCRTPQLVRYGHLTTQACLEKFSLRTQDFNAVDLTFQTRRAQQFNWFVNQILPDWTYGTQKFWYREAFRRTVWNVVLGNNWRNTAQIGTFVTYTKPSSVLTADYLDEIYRFLCSYGANQTPFSYSGDGMMYHVCITGPDEFRYLDELDRAQNTALGSRWSGEIVVPGYGKLRNIRNWIFLIEDDITRLGENLDGTYYEVDATKEINVGNGVESVANPDYYNPGVAKFTVNYLWNVSAAEWYVPPDFKQFPNQTAANWNGSFSIINIPTQADPKAENAYFLADFAFGIGPDIEARRAACVLSLAVHRRGTEVCPSSNPALVATQPTEYWVRNVQVDPYTSQLIFETQLALPGSCPAQYSLYLVTQGGYRAKLGSVVYSQTSNLPYQYKVSLVNSALATVRKCDPWQYIACLPDYEPTTATVANDCLTCSSAEECTFTAVLETEYVRKIRLKDGTQLNDETSGFNFPYDVSDGSGRTALDSDLTTYLASNGGGSVTVAYADDAVTVTVAGTTACLAQLVGDSGAKNFVKSDCAPAEG